MKTLLISAFSLLAILGFSLNASETQAKKHRNHSYYCQNSSYHCHWKHGQRYCHRPPVGWKGYKHHKAPVYFVSGRAPTPQCHWYLGRTYCSPY